MARAATERNRVADRPEVDGPASAVKIVAVGAAVAPARDTPKDDLPDKSEPQALDDAAEAAFLAEARDRGELVSPASVVAKAGPELPEEEAVERVPLPALAELVGRIPAEVRETLEELYRAKFIAVRRVPAKALKAAVRERKS